MALAVGNTSGINYDRTTFAIDTNHTLDGLATGTPEDNTAVLLCYGADVSTITYSGYASGFDTELSDGGGAGIAWGIQATAGVVGTKAATASGSDNGGGMTICVQGFLNTLTADAFIASSYIRDSDGGTTAVTKPTGAADGDITVVFCFSLDPSAFFSTTVPSGWTQIGGDGGTGCEFTAYWKVMASEGASWNFVNDGAFDSWYSAVTFRDVVAGVTTRGYSLPTLGVG